MPKVSVIIPAYNAERFIAQTLNSVLAQTFQNFEVIVVDDGSKDKTAKIAESYGAPVRCIKKANGGVSVARNLGMKEACGDYIAFLDADDLWHATKLEKQVGFLDENPEVGLCFTWIERIDENGKLLRRGEISDYADYCEALLLYLCFVTCSSVMLRKKIAEKTSGFDSRYTNYEDLEYWLRLSLITDFAAVPEYLLQYRVVKESASFNDPVILENNVRSILHKFFSTSDLPAKYKKVKTQCYSNNLIVLSGEYLHAKKYLDSLRCVGEAIFQRPANLTKPLGLPIRWLKRLISANN